MAKITLPPLPQNGSTLLQNGSVSDVHEPYTKSLYANFNQEDRKGLMSTLNGRLTYPNLNDNFRLEDYHIQPEQASLARVESMLDSSTVYGDGIPNLITGANFFTLPGCSLRWYQPYNTSVSLMQWSFFLGYNCWRGIYKDMDGVTQSRGVDSSIVLRCRLDDAVVPGSSRHLGQNMFHPISPGAVDREDQTGPGLNAFDYFKDTVKALGLPSEKAEIGLDGFKYPLAADASAMAIDRVASLAQRGGNPQYAPSEAHTATQFDLHHTAALAKGFHEISVECSMTLPDGAGVYLQNLGREEKTSVTGRGYFNLIGKVSLGIRNARVLNLL
tara:strand:- start:194 stop:1180 length:987 start_codon:yes stop_codon:yes gene_type:complete